MKVKDFELPRGPYRYVWSSLFAITLLFMQVRVPAVAQAGSRNVVISQLYGGGGNSGAILRNDFVELFNRGSTAVDITGWSVQYAAASGSTWMVTGLSGSIGPGQYYLVQEAQGKSGSLSLPAPDASGSINLSATSGKVALVSSSAPLSGSAPASPNVEGFVGYGAADSSEGSTASTLDNTMADMRLDGGCKDGKNNAADFTATTPNPRNTSSARHQCVSGNVPTISAATNAASFLPGAVSPGELVTIFGSDVGPTDLTQLQLTADGSHVTTSLADTRVLFDGIPAPLIYVSGTQLTAVVPFGVAGETATNLQVEFKGQLSNSVTLPVALAAPATFTVNQSGTGQAAVLNQDFSVNTALNPASSGTFVSIFGTGGGQTIPPGEDGKITGVDLASISAPVTAQIGGIEADVSYAGTAPGLVSGVVQINVHVPTSVATADAAPVLIHIGGTSSQLGSTLAVRNPDPALVCGSTCGEERWSVKNLTDLDAGKVDFSAQATTIDALLSLSPPHQLPEDQRIAPTEVQVFQVTARLVGFKLEADMDFHIVIADPADLSRTMIVEIPNPDCGDACRSGHSSEFAAARSSMNEHFGTATTSFRQLPPMLVSVTGIGFFDFIHGQTGVAPNGIELHPVLRIQFLQNEQ